MNRYILSFFITTILYSSLFAALFYNYNKTTKLESKSSKSNQSVKFTIISKAKTTTQKKVKKSEKKIIKKPKIKKKIEKKIKKKTIKKTPTKPIKKVETKKLKKPITPKKIEKQDIQKPIQKVKKDIPKKIVKKIVKKQTPSPKQIKQQIKQNKSKNEQKILNDNQKQQTKIKQNQYYSKIKNIIFKNKRYPKIAIRRGIESSVKVDFTISKDGKLLSFDIINGNKIFKNSIKDAITKSFPLTPPKGLFVTNINLSITIEYKLY